MATSWEHLLGGYATNTLTEEEKRKLFEAALHDQTLFDALADEEALKAMLADPETRQRILASLQAHEDSGAVATERGGWWEWFRHPSSLAWSGSIAALGLALIFGWQMEKEWGQVVNQEQEAAKSSSGDEVAYRAEKPLEEGSGAASNDALEERVNLAVDKKVEFPSTPEPAARVETDKVDRLGQLSAGAKQKSDTKEIGQTMRRQQANEQVAQAPSPSASSQSKVERSVQPLAVPQSPEEPLPEITPQAAAPGKFADRAVEEFDQATPGAQELFYASSGFLADEVIPEKKDKERMNQRSDQTLPGALSKELKHSSKKKALSFPLERDIAGGSAIPTTRGIRYSFVRQTKEGKEEEIEGRKITGNWSQVRLAVESNVPGFLYVLVPLGNGKWQNLVPIESNKTGQIGTEIKVKSFQRVEFSLDQLTDDTSGKPVVPIITVLLSSNPFADLGQWLGREVDMTEFQIERADGAVFVVNPLLNLEKPLHWEIPFGPEGNN